MRNRILLLLLIPGALCGGQTTPTAPGADTTVCPTGPGPVPEGLEAVCPPATNTVPNSGTTSYPQGTNPQAGTLPSGNNSLPVPAPSVPIPYKAVGPITARTEFQIFAEDEAGHPLQVFGRKLFDEVPTTFAPLDRIPVPANYVLGPGDELLIHVWGKIDLDTRVTVDRNGQVFVPTIGNLTVAGLRFDQLQSFLHSAIATLYKDFDLNVSLGQLRSIQVFVLGSARQPGVYTISSLSTLVNALFTSGGPSATGSMRHIQLRRSDQVVTEFDLYDLLRKGDKSHDVQLLPGDVIYIPPAGPQVAILGSVNEPGIYELRGDTTIAAALSDAGGLTGLAEADRVLLEQIENHRRRGVDDFPLDRSGLERMLKDGDMLRVFPISPQFDNAVMLRGNVSQPGHFPWHEGMRVSDLIPSRNFLITRSYWYQEGHLTESAPPGRSWSEENGVRCNRRDADDPNQEYGADGNSRHAGNQKQEYDASGKPREAEAEVPDQEYDGVSDPRDAGALNQEYGTDGNLRGGSRL